MPLCAYHWWRLSHLETLGGSTQHGSWRSPCCGQYWRWATGNAFRAFSVQLAGGEWLQAFIGSSGEDTADKE
eukprot:1568067-Lingulodinium_polyedra.AAC.1